MDIREVTIGQAIQIAKMFGLSADPTVKQTATGEMDRHYIDKFAVVRTYSAGVWCGKIVKKEGAEVVLNSARRMWTWHCARSISLSGVVANGIIREKSKVCAPLDDVWLEAIEILPISGEPLKSIMEAPIVEAEN